MIRASQGKVVCPPGVRSRRSASVCLIATAFYPLACSSLQLGHDTHINYSAIRIRLDPQTDHAERTSTKQFLALPRSATRTTRLRTLSYLPFGILILICLHSCPGEAKFSAIGVVPMFLAPFSGSRLLFLSILSPTGSFLDVTCLLDH